MMGNQTTSKVVTLKDLIHLFVRRLWAIVLAAVVAAVGLFAVNQVTYEPLYASTATIYILRESGESTTSGDASTDFSLALKVINDCTYMLKSHTVLDQVCQELALDVSYEDLYDSVSTNNPEDTRILEVTVEADSPQQAKAIVDSICLIGAERINEAMGFKQVNVYENGVLETKPCNGTSMTTYLLVGIAAAVLAYSVFLVVYLLDDSIRTDEEIERYLGLTVLGDIPDAGESRKKGYRYGGYGSYGAGKQAEKKRRNG